MNKFKIGDLVEGNDCVTGTKCTGKIIGIGTLYFNIREINRDSEVFIDLNTCKKLPIQKKFKFKVGERVMVPPETGILGKSIGGTVGTIIAIDEEYTTVKTISGKEEKFKTLYEEEPEISITQVKHETDPSQKIVDKFKIGTSNMGGLYKNDSLDSIFAAENFNHSKSDSISDILDERGSRYGAFADHAQITQDLKSVIKKHLDICNKVLADDQKEALDMIAHKIGRIINGDPNYADSWIDIAGYAKLVADRLEGKIR